MACFVRRRDVPGSFVPDAGHGNLALAGHAVEHRPQLSGLGLEGPDAKDMSSGSLTGNRKNQKLLSTIFVGGF